MTKRCMIGAAPDEARRPWPPARVPAAVSAPAACLIIRPFPWPPISLAAHVPVCPFAPLWGGQGRGA
jgi:hypothetical protein